jgi:uracil-DNA glycosylase family 4
VSKQAIGFFDLENSIVIRGDEKSKKGGASDRNSYYNCNDCGLFKLCERPYMSVSGNGRKKIMVVSSAPEYQDEKSGVFFTGIDGFRIRELIESHGLIPERDVWFTYAIRCRPHSEVNNKQIVACSAFLHDEITKHDPHVLILIGETAFQSVMGERISGRAEKVSYHSWVGECIPDQRDKRWICPIYDFSYIESCNNSQLDIEKTAAMKVWLDSWNTCLSLWDKPIPNYESKQMNMNVESDIKPVLAWLKEQTNKTVVFDYETTGLKPHRTGQRILAASVFNGKSGISFPFFQDQEFLDAWAVFLTDPSIGRIAHNITFETLWSYHAVHGWPGKWKSDSMLTAHVLNNRKSVNLKYLTYAKLGVIGYDDDAEVYIHASDDEQSQWGENAFNHMNEMPITKLLEYCGLDSVYGLLLWKQMFQQLEPFQMDGLDLLVEGQYTLAKIQNNGMCLSADQLKVNKEVIQSHIEEAKRTIFETQELKKWDLAKPFNPNSPQDLKYLLFDRLGYTSNKTTKKGNPSVNEEALLEFDIPLTRGILEQRRWEKALGTYIHQFEIEVVDGQIHSSFSTGTVKSFRSSSYGPPLQNVPTRDEEVKSAVRGLLVPRTGNKFIGYDYKSIEVMVAALYTQDRNLLKYVRDLTTDMHRDLAMDLFILSKPEDVKKMWRYWAKNRFVFPEFYGSYYRNCAPDLWKDIESDPELRQHLRDNNISVYQQFEDHVRDVEDDFWNVRFYEYNEWKKRRLAQFHKDGYVDSLTGFRYWAPMSDREALNYGIQGCLQRGSRVQTDQGLIPIEELVGKSVMVWTGFEWKKAVGLNMGVCRLATIHLDSGLKIQCDIRHKLKNELHRWVSFDQLRVGSYVALPKLQNVIEKNSSWSETYRFDKITDIEIHDTEDDTYTMSVDDDLHQFVADGVIQKNSAFHILLWSQTQIQKDLERKKITRSVLCSEIHDQLLADVHPDDEDLFDYLVWKWGTQKVRDMWKWITVPLLLEKEVSEVDQPWSTIKGAGYLINPYTRDDSLV